MGRSDLLTTQAGLSIVGVAAGVMLLFVEGVSSETICKLLAWGLVVLGIVSCIRFFVAGEWRTFESVGFAEGILLCLLGLCGLLRMQELVLELETCLGLVNLVLSAILLQEALQLKGAKGKLWILVLIVALAAGTAAVVVVADVRSVLDAVQNFVGWSMLVVGICSLVTMVYTFLTLRRLERESREGAQHFSDAPADGRDGAEA